MKKADTVEEYIANEPSEVRKVLQDLRKTILSVSKKGFTEKISYGMPSVWYNDHPLVYYASFKGHCSFFGGGKAVIKEFKNDLEGFKIAASTIRFTPKKPLPSSLVKKIVKYRMKENDEKFG